MRSLLRIRLRAAWLLFSGVLLVAALVITSFKGSAGSRPASAQPIVVLLSLDGVSESYMGQTETPALSRIAERGARADRLTPPFPSNTFPSHATLATGVYPDRHGIVNNQFNDPERGEFRKSPEASWYESEPLWAAAERAGVRTAVQHWVCSAGKWQGIAPTYFERFRAGASDVERLSKIVAWLGLPEARRPRLIMSWLAGCDHAGHKHGPDDPAVLVELRFVDGLLGRLLAEIERLGLGGRVTLFVVSDHGMLRMEREIDLGDLISRPSKPKDIVSSGAVANLYFDSAEKIEGAEKELSKWSHFTLYRRETLPEELHYRHPHRTGDL
ncbi:MAG: ectonucleotide pyrophosphatase/phosphodiesterase, partial [Vicinamibacteria bacterium]